MKNAAKILSIISLFLSTGNIFAQNINRNGFIKDSIDVYINRALTNWRIPGAAVCIIKDDRIVLMKGYGVKELGLNNKVDEGTLFMIGSNTKAFTATALTMLQAQHKLLLDDKVTKYIPSFKLDNKLAGDDARLRDLLCHRLGFQTFQGDFTYWTSNLTREQVIEKMAHVKAVYPFRAKWGYTNAAFLTAGEVITRVTERSWEAYIKDNIFAPLGMGSTLALTKDFGMQINKAAAHTLVDGRLVTIPFAQLDNLAPAASICSSVTDLSKWVMVQLNNGKVGPRQVIAAEAIAATRQPQDIVGDVQHLNGTTSVELYGLGFFLQDYAGHRIVMHDGGVNGYVTSVTLVPDQHLGIIILTNTDQNLFFDALRWEIMDAYFKMPYRNYSEVYLTRFKNNAAAEQAKDKKLRDSVALNLHPSLPLSAYTGKYFNDLYGYMTIEQGGENNDLQMRFEHHPKMYAHLQALGGNRFYVTFSDPVFGKAVFPFTFSNGRVTGVRVKVDDEVEITPYDFKKVQ
ncbi:CubicO group peptidase (beta-lactamase class C family) [Mucilaginibacter gracilis]|uniref:CubicO group peptidase (Beta-lactamase class C family) n=1 Tax=Mucilaginibacter gracilis TaxID=423350 RepID=A0A495IY64_9SPHI|nr:serine hydrolase [Mucilaginibacter gracilis]RKR81627.1 CubicO group peptidase (beta-lactamase class C family) [Mucilaginibacter gracilis]